MGRNLILMTSPGRKSNQKMYLYFLLFLMLRKVTTWWYLFPGLVPIVVWRKKNNSHHEQLDSLTCYRYVFRFNSVPFTLNCKESTSLRAWKGPLAWVELGSQVLIGHWACIFSRKTLFCQKTTPNKKGGPLTIWNLHGSLEWCRKQSREFQIGW